MTPPAIDWKHLAGQLRDSMSVSSVRLDKPLGPMTTYRVGGAARLFVEAGSHDDLASLARITSRFSEMPILAIGRGSNLLISDKGFEGLAIRLGEAFAGCRIEGSRVTAGAALTMPAAARMAASAGLGGFSWAVGVPGSVGGAVRMNAGGHGSDIAEVLLSVSGVDLLSGSAFTLTKRELRLGYRRSAVSRQMVLAEAVFGLRPSDPGTEKEVLASVVRWRRVNQPGGSNAGSVFMNPEGDSAGRLIDEAGCKGMRFGCAVVSPKHANFIIADSGGSADDVLHLMAEVACAVKQRSNVTLIPETRLAGFDSPWQEFLSEREST